MSDQRSTSVSTDVVSEPPATTLHAVPYDETASMDDENLALRSASLPTPVHSIYSDTKSARTSASSGRTGDLPGLLRPSSHRSTKADFTPPSPIAKDRKSLADDTVSLRSLRSVPNIVVNDSGARPSSRPGSRPGSRWSERKWGGLRHKRSGEFERKAESPPPVPQIEPQFNPISLDIPTASLDGLGSQSMRFSKRGSLINKGDRKRLEQQEEEHDAQKQVEGHEAQQQREQSAQEGPPQQEETNSLPAQSPAMEQNAPEAEPPAPETEVPAPEAESPAPPVMRPKPPSSSLRVRQSTIASRAISADEDMLSRRVRLMYDKGEENVTDSEVAQSLAMDNGMLWEDGAAIKEVSGPSGSSSQGADTKSITSSIGPDVVFKKEAHELAGGIEYWQNIGAGDVDRYGFIRSPTSNSAEGIDPSPIQRVSTSLLLASETPRRKHSIRPPSALASNRSFHGRPPTRKNSEHSIRPTSSQSTYSAPLRRTTTRFRQATNHLPHNRDRRYKDEAADMLTLPMEPATSGEGLNTPAARAARKKEWEREDKWTKMARPSRKSKDGGGMRFEFDTQSSKLIERTWKGIPDRWRSTAWYSFLEASAKRHSDSPTEEDLIEAYHEYQMVSSPDDVQIDIDVPRTITSHIMFRRRYRGGQRLLFRVLHAMSLYFPDTGYVQGMAALAATLLAYFDEEHTFIMLVRLWQLRGLEQLYRSGFEGLMEALGDFEREWLAGGEVATQLNEVGIPPTAYGTRWYLTLFNYSIPFAAQLRVWDVFMLLGDADDITSSGKRTNNQNGHVSSFGKGLDVLHATSAALIDGMRDIILESDFENAMKVLTSWVPIKDVELFMRVAKAEWKVHRKRTH
ncbi:RabGAP/TBC [Aspergillus taichungensis]|uniref:RabGAP/TBC n=1 Tax=Aspergillus taichungensis TaxID=482145 RepID=A0A2J5HDX1_9EURO|nr:RabGAP/TBC [Aspergillus taichungensis]